MKTSLHQLVVFYMRLRIYKSFKGLFEESPQYRLWWANRGEEFKTQLAIYQSWQKQQDIADIQKLSTGVIKPSWLQLAQLSVRSFLYRKLKLFFKRSTGYQQWRISRKESKAIQVAARLRQCINGGERVASTLLKGTDEEAQGIAFPICESPTVSVLVPVYNKIEYTLTCLKSIQAHLPITPFEVIVIDDCSTDDTQKLLLKIKGLRLIRNESNLGFLLNCNKAAKEARGEYLLFLNNDTEVEAGWLDELVSTFHIYPDAGLVGSKLLFPNGTQQEAGGIIWRDATGANYGRDANPERPEFCYVRDPDYCSGASIMIPRELFQTLGGFDERYIPAYYEDTDLAFSVRAAGRRVIFQPFSRVVHYEGVTSGTDTTKGVKAYQVHNREKFLAKWQTTLATHGAPNHNIRFARERKASRRALIIDLATPTPDKDSGSIDVIHYIKIIQTLGYQITFAPASLFHAGRYTEELQRIGVECLYTPHTTSIYEHIEAAGSDYDLVILKRARVAARYIKQIRKHCTNAKIIFNTVDLHFLREERQAVIEESTKLKRRAKKTKLLERMVMEGSDATIVISDSEREVIAREWPHLRVATIPYVREVRGCNVPFSGRRDIVFIGSFDHAPNVDAVLYFVSEIWPLVHSAIPEVNFRIVGSKATPEIKELEKNPGVIFDGYIPDLDPVFNSCRLSVAPLRFGAGIKGKIGTSLGYGVPCIATPIAAEGMGLIDEQEVLIASSSSDFANLIVKGYRDAALWNRLSSNGIAFMHKQYSFESGLKNIQDLIGSIK